MTLAQLSLLRQHFEKVYFNTFDSTAWEHVEAIDATMQAQAQAQADAQAEALNKKYQ